MTTYWLNVTSERTSHSRTTTGSVLTTGSVSGEAGMEDLDPDQLMTYLGRGSKADAEA